MWTRAHQRHFEEWIWLFWSQRDISAWLSWAPERSRMPVPSLFSVWPSPANTHYSPGTHNVSEWYETSERTALWQAISVVGSRPPPDRCRPYLRTPHVPRCQGRRVCCCQCPKWWNSRQMCTCSQFYWLEYIGPSWCTWSLGCHHSSPGSIPIIVRTPSC